MEGAGRFRDPIVQRSSTGPHTTTTRPSEGIADLLQAARRTSGMSRSSPSSWTSSPSQYEQPGEEPVFVETSKSTAHDDSSSSTSEKPSSPNIERSREFANHIGAEIANLLSEALKEAANHRYEAQQQANAAREAILHTLAEGEKRAREVLDSARLRACELLLQAPFLDIASLDIASSTDPSATPRSHNNPREAQGNPREAQGSSGQHQSSESPRASWERRIWDDAREEEQGKNDDYEQEASRPTSSQEQADVSGHRERSSAARRSRVEITMVGPMAAQVPDD
ncbi:MAG: hypothetical protein M1131_03375 [Actinobacteria bacterium]|nr:hypothetical protein [Actinomycetota bacterium]